MFCTICNKETNNPKFCSRSCSATYNNSKRIRSQESKEKISRKMKFLIKNKIIQGPKERKITNKGARWAKPPNNEWKKYKQACTFYTPYYLLEKIEGHELVKEIGWWHPIKNKNGASRDHLYSVKDGWNNDISVDIIKHLANCKIIPHKQNSKKGKKSVITLNQLKKRIKEWSDWRDSNPH